MLTRNAKSNKPASFLYECELCGIHEAIPADVIDHFDEVDPGLPGQPPTFRCEQCPGIMYPEGYLRAERAEPKAS